ncbi:phosphotransferase enzyme family protein [Paenibacillus contaminans]|uniref:phosphotransferase enzyme family protein n=1 Tax=Paenibacillus contaminans TaxID=450362 RepID=UPI0013144F35|nr:aminoglycoside phosphotransferase family protein [Paenibacillus contaminans]
MELLRGITWIERTDLIDELLEQELTVSKLPSGLEAKVMKYSSSTNSVVLKLWDKESDPDVRFQHVLLSALRHRGISVSGSYGWGYTASNHKVLLTSFDGSPISILTDQIVKDLADLLLRLHQVSLHELDSTLHQKYDFIPYFYPGLEEHQDIQAELVQLVNSSNLQQNTFIHGDFNLGNILDDQGKYTIIDWTNAQLGDARYDLAWASFLINLYNGEELAAAFRNAYLSKSEFDMEEIQRFEAIACLRWLLLSRITDVPKNEKTIEQINEIIIKNKHLNTKLTLMQQQS